MATDQTAASPTEDERILAALAHAGIILPFWGMIGALVIWATQREKSRFVGFQAVQAIAYQLVLLISGIAGFACLICSIFGLFLTVPLGVAIGMAGAGPNVVGLLAGIAISFFPFAIMGIFMLLALVLAAYGLYGAACTLQGREFRYAVIGRKMEQYLAQGRPAQ